MNSIKTLTILSDVHQKYNQLSKMSLNNSYVVQLGDLGFDYSYIYENYDPNKFKICLGNHDCYDCRPKEYDLGDYGPAKIGPWQFFFVRGAFSIDVKGRKIHQYKTHLKSWWGEEQLNYRQGKFCLKSYENFVSQRRKFNQNAPIVVLSHSCPAFLSETVGKPGILQQYGWPSNMITSTQELLQDLYDIHPPDVWCFGHYHTNWQKEIGSTLFICRKELGYVDFDKNWEVVDYG